jgi:hypothetical protein
MQISRITQSKVLNGIAGVTAGMAWNYTGCPAGHANKENEMELIFILLFMY